ncbi:MAG: hypothetical protein ACR2MX_00465 [Cyclobacteriaceae bacterium]
MKMQTKDFKFEREVKTPKKALDHFNEITNNHLQNVTSEHMVMPGLDDETELLGW